MNNTSQRSNVGARNFLEPGQKIYREFIYDIIYINSHKEK